MFFWNGSVCAVPSEVFLKLCSIVLFALVPNMPDTPGVACEEAVMLAAAVAAAVSAAGAECAAAAAPVASAGSVDAAAAAASAVGGAVL